MAHWVQFRPQTNAFKKLLKAMCKSPEPSRSCIQRDRWKLHAPRPPHTFCTWTTSPFRFGPQALQSWLPKRRLHWKRPRKWSQGRQSPESFAPANSFEKNSPMARGMKTEMESCCSLSFSIASHIQFDCLTPPHCASCASWSSRLMWLCLECIFRIFWVSSCQYYGMFVDVGHRWPAASTLPIL